MSRYSLVTNPLEFRNAFLAQVTDSIVDKQIEPVLRVLLYYIWRGAFESRAAVVNKHVQGDLGLLCLSAYKAFLPVLQMLRLGYWCDAMILLRALMERIALVGYLHKNRQYIPQYAAGKGGLQKKAMIWAKQQSLENWMVLYSLLSNVTHSRLEGPAGHLLDQTSIGAAFRLDLTSSPEGGADMTDDLCAGIVYALLALDPILVEIIDYKSLAIFPIDPDVLIYLSKDDLVSFQDFLQKYQDEYYQKSQGGT